MVNIATSVAFVEQSGSAVHKARMSRVLFGREPDPEVLGGIAAAQNDDGGFPLGMVVGRPSSLDETLTTLWHLDELGALGSPSGERALGYLSVSQEEDGGWDENSELVGSELPPWIRPGEVPTRLYLSSYAAYWLGLAGHGSRAVLDKALAYVLGHQMEDGQFPGYPHTTWIAASALLLAGGAYSESAERALRALAEREVSQWADSQIAWILNCLAAAAVPADHTLVGRLLPGLEARASPEGSWASEDGEPFVVDGTIEALRALKQYGLLAEDRTQASRDAG